MGVRLELGWDSTVGEISMCRAGWGCVSGGEQVCFDGEDGRCGLGGRDLSRGVGLGLWLDLSVESRNRFWWQEMESMRVRQ